MVHLDNCCKLSVGNAAIAAHFQRKYSAKGAQWAVFLVLPYPEAFDDHTVLFVDVEFLVQFLSFHDCLLFLVLDALQNTKHLSGRTSNTAT